MENIGGLGNAKAANTVEGLKQATAGYSKEVLIAAINQKVFTAEQARAIMTAKAVEAAEAQQIITTAGLTTAEATATGVTAGFKASIKGLGVELKALSSAHPILLGITVAIAAMAGAYKIINVCTTSFEELSEKAAELNSEIANSQSEMDSYTSKLDEVDQKIKDIQNLGTLSFTDKQELENLQNQRQELENLYNIEKARHDLVQSDLEKNAQEYLNKKSSSKYKTEYYTQMQMKNGQFTNVGYARASQITPLDEMKSASKEMLAQQNIIDSLNEEYSKYSNPTEAQTTEFSANLKKTEEARDKARQYALDIQKEAQLQVSGLSESSESYQEVFNASQVLSDNLALMEGNIKGLSEAAKRAYFKANYDGADKSTFTDFIDGLSDEDLTVLADVKFNDTTSIEELRELIGKAQKEAGQQPILFTNLSYSGTIAELDEMKNAFSALNSAYSSFIDKDKNIDFDALSALNEKFKDVSGIDNYIRAIQNAKGNAKATQIAFDNLLTAYIKHTGITDNVTEGNARLIKSFFEEHGITAILANDIDLVAAEKYYAANASFDLANVTESELAAFIGEAESAGIARASIVKLMMAKISCNNTGIVTDGDINNLIALANAAGIAEAAVKNAQYAQKQKNAPGVVRSAGAENAINTSIADNLESGMRTDLYKPKEYKLSGGRATNAARKSNASGGGDAQSRKETEAQKKEFNWIRQALDSISRSRDKILRSVEDETNSYQDQLSALQQLLALDEQVITTNQSALDIYSRQWDEIRQKIIAAFGEADGNALISKIMNGNVSPEGYEDIFAADSNGNNPNTDLIDQAMAIYAAFTQQEDALEDSINQRTEDIRKEFEIRISMIKASVDEVGADMDKLQSKMDIKETTGQMITEADYQRMSRLSKEQISLYYDQIDALEEQADEVEEGSAEYYNLQSQIASCSNAISQCERQQAEWNEEILNLPIRRIERYLELLKHIKQDMTNKIDEQSSLGIAATKEQLQSLIDISTQQIEKLREEHEELTKKLGNYEYGSSKFNETAGSLQDVEDEISSLIQAQNEWNKQIIQIPFDKISNLSKQLGNIRDALDGITDAYDTAIGAVVDAIEAQVDAINDLKDAAANEYEAKLKPYQDELDVLKKQNEERKIQLALEQAAYDLDRARNQKTNQVVRNGEINYEADQDAIRAANQAKSDAGYNKIVHDLEKQISALEEERDKLLEGYDLQIEKLDKIKEKWSEIAGNIEKAQNNVTAGEILGNGWEEKVLSGNDTGIFDMMKKNYENIAAQKELYDKQIDAAEKVSSLMQQYADSFQNGSMSYQDVLSKFNELILASKDGFSSREYLDAVLNATGSKDMASALENLQNQMSGSYDDLKEYLKSANTNRETISKYTATWEEIKKTLEEQLATLKKLAEEESKKAANSRPSTGSGGGGKGHSSSKGPNWNTPDGEATGPAKEIEEREKQKKSLPAYKDGIENGLVGVPSNSNEKFKIVQSLSTEELDTDEVRAIIHKGEAVLNQKQMDTLWANVSQFTPIPGIVPITPDFSNFNLPDRGTRVEFNMGDVVLHNIDNTEQFVNALSREFEPAMRQKLSRY